MPFSILIRSGSLQNENVGSAAAPPRLTFDGPRIVIGRGPGSEVRLPDPSVSQRHATVRVEGASYTLQDEGSTNGTFVGGVRLHAGSPRTLRDGDVVRVGRVWLEVRIDQTPATLDLPTKTRDIALRLVRDAMRAVGDDVAPRIDIVEGPDRGRTLTLSEEGRAYLAGRGEDSDFLLDDPDGSRRHLQVVRRGDSVLVRDIGSKNGAWLGEILIPKDRDVLWRGPLMVRVGQNVLALEEPVLQALAELEAAEDEALPDDGAPQMPPGAASSPEAAAYVAPAREPLIEPQGPRPGRVVPKPIRPAWSGADLAVVVAAVSILVLSAAGLYWLLRG